MRIGPGQRRGQDDGRCQMRYDTRNCDNIGNWRKLVLVFTFFSHRKVPDISCTYLVFMLTLYTTAKTEARFFITNHIIAETKRLTSALPTLPLETGVSPSLSRCPKILMNAIKVVVAVYLR